MKLRKLIEFNDDFEFWRGTKLRKMNVGMNVENRDDDYYDYILAYANWDSESMMLVNITEDNIKAGAVYGGVVHVDKSKGKAVVTVSGLKYTLGDDLKDWYLLEND